MPTYRIEIWGKVHGVGFRDAAQQCAQQCGVTGSVANKTHPQRVEIFCTVQDKKSFDDFLTWCSHGPRGARVDMVKVSAVDDQSFDAFTIIA